MKIVAIYKQDRDAQIAVNQLQEDGYPSEEISALFTEPEKFDEAVEVLENAFEEDSEEMVQEEMIDKSADEEDVMEYARGVLEPLESQTVVTADGEVYIAGPLIDQYNNDLDVSVTIADLLLDLGIDEEQVAAIEQRILSGQILIMIELTEENLEEYKNILAETSPAVLLEIGLD